eukprot:CAMPEP_0201663944 /NCGR_PEP_ID=MMETSP0494-20130426/5579_1 /ASSEMBLY_ACC=CAM_ASM_000839 /TAXON_ID=420259 /ORGANISM="Thalassiosira gravida, Strain GMp14c1" /LENGTH=150 /DNA_ID=CAMNT_0048142635 /DNA_START=45 /DNA_END=497 /DNA_ORIENTATION=+
MNLFDFTGLFFLLPLVAGNSIRGSVARQLSPDDSDSSCPLPWRFFETAINSQFHETIGGWDKNPLTSNGVEIGKSSGNCIVLPGQRRFSCLMTLEFPNVGNVMLQGFESMHSNVDMTLGLLGGTGCYEGKTGSYSVRANSRFNKFTYALD